MKKDFISIKDFSAKEVEALLSLSAQVKKNPKRYSRILAGKTLALIFEKPSNRTYVSFSVGMYQLGGNSIYLGPEHIKLGVRESIADVARTLERYVDAIVLRTFSHDNVLEMANSVHIPVINGLSDFSHPCQALADIFTVREKFGKKKNINMAYIGDGNNVCNSLIFICAKTGINLRIASPVGYAPDQCIIDQALADAEKNHVKIQVSNDPKVASSGADVLYADVWASMGQEAEANKRKHDFTGYQINSQLLALAKKDAIIMHCLPAHRGEEITDEVIDGKHSVVFDQAENRMHVEKAILVKLLCC